MQQAVESFFLGNLEWILFAEGVFVDTSECSKGSVDVFGANANAGIFVR